MAILTSHTLNGTDGTHAGGIKVTFSLVGGEKIFETKMDEGGRLNEKIGSEHIDPTATYELVFETGPYWIERGYNQIMDQVVLRFKMPDPTTDYHMPVIISPNSYSVWWSS
jgi:5-hydroxyisourate hydrolase